MFLLFKKPEYRKFSLKPRYWDPVKEEQEARKKRIRAELGLEENSEQYIPDVRGQMRKEYEKRKAARSSLNTGYTLRLFMILVMLFIAAFYVFVKNPEGIMRFFGL